MFIFTVNYNTMLISSGLQGFHFNVWYFQGLSAGLTGAGVTSCFLSFNDLFHVEFSPPCRIKLKLLLTGRRFIDFLSQRPKTSSEAAFKVTIWVPLVKQTGAGSSSPAPNVDSSTRRVVRELRCDVKLNIKHFS